MNKKEEINRQTEELFTENEWQSNRLLCIIMFGYALFLFIFMLSSYMGLISLTPGMMINACLIDAIIIMISSVYGFFFGNKGIHIKYLLMLVLIIGVNVTHFCLTVFSMFFLMGPIVISTKYYNRKFTLITAAANWVFLIAGCTANIILEKNFAAMRLFHRYQGIEIWGFPKDAIMYRLIPETVVMLILLIICLNISESGRRLVRRQAEIGYNALEMKNEIDTAVEIQESVIPEKKFITSGNEIQITAAMKPAREAAGDFYDYFMADENTLAIITADVSDKGLSAAMFMMSAINTLRFAIKTGKDIGQAFSEVNRVLAEDNPGCIFVTVWAGLIDIRTGVGKYANAGHTFPIIKHSDGEIEVLTNNPDTFIGVFDDFEINTHVFKLRKDDIIVLYTDGVTDSMNPAGETFGDRRLREVIKKTEGGTDELCDSIIRKTEEFSDNEHQFDDKTLLLARVNSDCKPDKYEWVYDVSDIDIEQVIDNTDLILNAVSCPDNVRRLIDTAIDEILGNITEYAYENGQGAIAVKIEAGHNYIEMSFRDKGLPFNPLKTAEPLFEDLLQVGGYGIYLVKTIADETNYIYENGENILTFIKVWRSQ